MENITMQIRYIALVKLKKKKRFMLLFSVMGYSKFWVASFRAVMIILFFKINFLLFIYYFNYLYLKVMGEG